MAKVCPIKAIGVIQNWQQNSGYGHECCDESNCALWDSDYGGCTIKALPYMLDQIAVRCDK